MHSEYIVKPPKICKCSHFLLGRYEILTIYSDRTVFIMHAGPQSLYQLSFVCHTQKVVL